MRKKTILESPYSGDVEKNIDYAKKCLRDSLERDECPFASHLLYGYDHAQAAGGRTFDSVAWRTAKQ